jgi:hypothetical protein
LLSVSAFQHTHRRACPLPLTEDTGVRQNPDAMGVNPVLALRFAP